MYEQTLKYISETLLQHDIAVSNPGLLHGKTGVVVFLFHYARYTGNKSYEDYAMALMDSMQQQIQQQYTTNYAEGLAGIGVAIEYLAQNGFIEDNTNEALENFDRVMMSATIFGDHTDVSLFTGLSGLGRYLLFRVAGHCANDNHIGTLDNKMLLVHITDIFERMYPSLKKTDLEDVLRFLYAMNQTNIYPAKTRRLIKLLLSDSSSLFQDDIMCQHQVSIEAIYNSKYLKLLSDIQENIQVDIIPGLYEGLAGIGLYLLEKLDKRHETWRILL